MKYVVKVERRRAERGMLDIEHTDVYVVALQNDPYQHQEPIGTRAQFSEIEDDAFVFSSLAAAEVVACTVGGVVHQISPEPGEDAYTDLRAKIFTLASDYEHSANQYEIAMRNDRKAKEQRRQEWFVTASVFRNVASQLRSTLP